MRGAEERISSPSRLSATAAAVIAFPTTIPPTGTRNRGFGSNMPSATTSTSVRPPACASAISSGQKAPGTWRARLRAVSAPNRTIAEISATTNTSWSCSKIALITRPTALSWMNERTTAIADVALEVHALPDRDRDRDRDQQRAWRPADRG